MFNITMPILGFEWQGIPVNLIKLALSSFSDSFCLSAEKDYSYQLRHKRINEQMNSEVFNMSIGHSVSSLVGFST